jgi:hypothetical protein
LTKLHRLCLALALMQIARTYDIGHMTIARVKAEPRASRMSKGRGPITARRFRPPGAPASF